MPEPEAAPPRIAVFAPRGRSADLLTQRIASLGAEAEVVMTAEVLAHRLEGLETLSRPWDALVVMFEELGSADALTALTKALRRQPSWSALPVLACASDLRVFDDELGADLLAVPGVRPILRPVAWSVLGARLERALAERTRQYRVREAIAELEAARATSEAHASDLERATRGLAHDLRTPLNALMLALDYIEKDGSDGNHGILHRARRTARQMEELTEELLAYARLTSGRKDADGPELVPLGPLLERVAGRLELLTRERGGAIDVGPMPVVWGNEVLMRQVARNLLVNALRYSDAAVPRVRIWCETEPARHVIRFGDNGRGVAPEDRERIFEAFFRRATEVTGTGLGLALCREAMTRQGGEIWLESSGPDGSVFAVALPRPPEPSSADDHERV